MKKLSKKEMKQANGGNDPMIYWYYMIMKNYEHIQISYMHSTLPIPAEY